MYVNGFQTGGTGTNQITITKRKNKRKQEWVGRINTGGIHNSR